MLTNFTFYPHSQSNLKTKYSDKYKSASSKIPKVWTATEFHIYNK